MFQSSRSSSGAMLILMALTMAFSIITAAALATSINNINIKTLSERSRSLVKELDMVESKFEETLNASIINPESSNEEAICKTFKEVVENFSKIELTHGIFFNANLTKPITYDYRFKVSNSSNIYFKDEVVLYMSMDNVDFLGNPLDNSTYNNDGEKKGNAQQTSNGKFGYGFSFDGVNGSVSVDSLVSETSKDNAGAISFWVKTGDTDEGVLISQNDHDDAGDYIMLLVNYYQSGVLEGDIGTGKNWRFYGTTTITDNSWHHVVVSSDGSKNYFYIDGKKESVTFTQGSNDGSWFNDVGPGQDNFSIGVLNREAPYGFLDGKIDEVCVFNRNLSRSEVDALYNATAPEYLIHEYFASLTSDVVIVQKNTRISGKVTFDIT